MSYCKSTIAINKNISILSYSTLEFLCIFLFWKADCCYLSLIFQSHFLNHCLSLWCNVLVYYCLESVLTDFWSFIFMGCMCSQAVIIKKCLSANTLKICLDSKHTFLCYFSSFSLLYLELTFPLVLLLQSISPVFHKSFFFFFCAGLFCPSLCHHSLPHLSLSLSLLFDG